MFVSEQASLAGGKAKAACLLNCLVFDCAWLGGFSEERYFSFPIVNGQALLQLLCNC